MMHFRKGRGGSSLVEFAVVVPLLVLTLFAICQWGLIFAAQITVRNASAVGARQAIVNSNTNAVIALAKAALAPMLDPSKAPNPTLTVTNIAGVNALKMTVSYNLPLIIKFVVPGGGSNKTISASTIIR